MARNALLRPLGRLENGELQLRDQAGAVRLGTPGSALRAAIDIHDVRFYRAVVLGGSLSAAEAYLRGWWSSPDLVQVMRLFARNEAVLRGTKGGLARLSALGRAALHGVRRNTKAGSRRNIEAHYDIGNDLFELMLDETMTYSCGVFERPDSTLSEASVAKLDRLCRKLDLRSTDVVLEIGCGWGSFATHAASRYGCRVRAITISPAQHAVAVERIQRAGLSERVDIVQQDYRDVTGTYDKVASIEMIEAVGHQYYDQFFKSCRRVLRPGGRFAMQAITIPDRRFDEAVRHVDFIKRYVFPGSCIPSVAILDQAASAAGLQLTGQEDLTAHYVTTLRHWRERFTTQYDAVRRLGYSERFMRLWHYYLAYCEGGFAERYIGSVQLVWELSAGSDANGKIR